MPRDNYGALAYLRTRPDVKANSIAILGQSAGADAMFYTIAEGALPKELSPEQYFRAAIAFYPGCQRFFAREPKWKPRQPLLLLMARLTTRPQRLARSCSPRWLQAVGRQSKRIGIQASTTPSIILTSL
jgi:dienelactone hydrolase